jgi:hypothetical protein
LFDPGHVLGPSAVTALERDENIGAAYLRSDLSEQIIRDLLRDRRTGTTHRALAERYGISLSSVKRVPRRHRG